MEHRRRIDPVIRYAVVRIMNNLETDGFHIYSDTYVNPQKALAYMETLKPKYHKTTKWYVMPIENAKQEERKYKEWLIEQQEIRYKQALRKYWKNSQTKTSDLVELMTPTK